MYDIAGASHVVVVKAPTECTLPQSRLDWAPVSRSSLVRLNAWIAHNTNPPANNFMPLERAGAEPSVLRAPAHLPEAVIQLPQRDSDGNAVAAYVCLTLLFHLEPTWGNSSCLQLWFF